MTAPTGLLKKLQIKAGMKLWLVDVPQAVAEELTAGAEVEPVHAGDDFDGVIAFCETVAELEALMPRIFERMPADGLLWLAYRKGEVAKASGFDRDHGWDAVEAQGWRPVRQVAIDDAWSALRFRPVEKVKAKEGSRFAR
jgi:hypothetical protein